MRARTCIDEKSIEVASTRAEFDAAIDAHARSLPKYGHVKFITDALARMDEVGVRCVGYAACYRRPHAYADACAQLCASRPRLFACLRDCSGVHVLVVVQRIQRSVAAFDGLWSSHLWLLASQPPRSHHTTPTINCNVTQCPANATDCTVLCQGALSSDPRAISGCALSVAAT
jgi:hypothetical protein